MAKIIREELASVGNVKTPLDLSVKIANFGGFAATSECILKLYYMTRPQERINPEKTLDLENFLMAEIRRNEITPEIGLGFAIYSEGCLNVARWRKENPIVLRNQIYIAYPNMPVNTIALGDISSEGSFCLWELGIVGHERNAWKKYLESKMTTDDKYDYVNDFIIGSL